MACLTRNVMLESEFIFYKTDLLTDYDLWIKELDHNLTLDFRTIVVLNSGLHWTNDERGAYYQTNDLIVLSQFKEDRTYSWYLLVYNKTNNTYF